MAEHVDISRDEAVKMLLDELREQLDSFPQKERGPISMLFGLEDGVRFSLAEVGQFYGLSYKEVQALRDKAFQSLHRQNTTTDAAPTEPQAESDQRAAQRAILPSLNSFESMVATVYFGLDVPQLSKSDICRAFHLTEQEFHAIEQRIQRRLRHQPVKDL